MKLLLTSAGITNKSIAHALRDLLGKPTNESKIVVVPTGHNPEPGDKSWVFEEDFRGPHELSWKEFSIIDLAAVSSLDKSLWWPQFEDADVLLFGGGNCFYLCYWLQQSGVFDAMPKWLESKLYVGISAGSMVATESLRTDSLVIEKMGDMRLDDYGDIGPKGQSSDKTLGLTDFAFRPHLNSPEFPKAKEELIKKLTPKLDVPLYALDDQSALKVVDGRVEVVSEGKWLLLGK